MSECRSFGSHYKPCSQTRKISIGVIVDSQNTGRSSAKVDGLTVRKTGNIAADSKVNNVFKTDGHGVGGAINKKQTGTPVPESSPWISTGPFFEDIPFMTPFPDAIKESALPTSSCLPEKSHGARKAQASHSVQFFSKLESNLQSGTGNMKKFRTPLQKRKEGNHVMQESFEEGSFAAAQEDLGSGKGLTENKSNGAEKRSSEALKMKLWEILATVSSPAEQMSSSQNVKEEPRPRPNLGEQSLMNVNPRPNSDTIETDSEVDPNIQRPVTRSLNRKRRQPILQANKHINDLPPGKRCSPVNRCSLLPEAKKNKRTRNRTQPRKNLFSENSAATNTVKDTGRSTKQSSAEEAPSLRNMHAVETQTQARGKDIHKSSMTEKAERFEELNIPTMSERPEQQEEMERSDLNQTSAQQHDFESPTFEFRLPSNCCTPSPGSPLGMNQGEEGVSNPTPDEKRSTVRDDGNFRTSQTSTPDLYKSKDVEESADDAEEFRDSLTGKSVPSQYKTDLGDGFFSSSSEEDFENNSNSDEDDTGPVTLFPEIQPIKKSKFMLRPTKRLRRDDSKGTEDTEDHHVQSGENENDGLARAVAIFALALERVKSKMKSAASKKSSDVMVSASETISLQMRNVVSQIQKDVAKLTSLSKSKRKQLEARLQEQQDKMRNIQEKFKREVDQHLLDCSSTVEGLEAHEIETKRAIEKQKASHKKLFLQVEETIQVQLNDAQRRMASIQKLTREKMLQLKLLMSECLKDGLLSEP